jgi:uncharacterized RDD family membrane protein YckC
MSSIAQAAVLPNAIFQMEKTSEFSPESLKAPFFLRCAALFIDYMLLLAVPVVWLIVFRFFGEAGAKAASISITVWLFALIVWLMNFLALPLFRGQTFGKMLAGISIVKLDGTPVHLGRILLRNAIGYFLTALTLGIGFLIAAVNSSGRSLHDYVAGTIVVYGRKRQK